MAMVQIKVSGIKQTLIHILVSSLDALISVITSPLGLGFLSQNIEECLLGIVGRGKTGLFLILCTAHVRHSVNSTCETIQGFPLSCFHTVDPASVDASCPQCHGV